MDVDSHDREGASEDDDDFLMYSEKLRLLSELGFYYACTPWKGAAPERYEEYHNKVASTLEEFGIKAHRFFAGNPQCEKASCFKLNEFLQCPDDLYYQGKRVYKAAKQVRRTYSSMDGSLDGFNRPSKVAKAASYSSRPSTPTYNRFNVLKEQTNENLSNGKTSEDKIKENESVRIPPILIKIPPNFSEYLKELNLKLQTPVTAKLSGELFKLQPHNFQDRETIVNFCTKKESKFIKTKTSEEKLIKVVIRGLDINTPIEEINFDLTEHGFDIFKINQLHKGKERLPLPLFQIQLENNDLNKKIYEVNTILYVAVKIETYKNLKVIQCFNCQRFGHVAINCLSGPKCLKCAGSHSSKDCLQQNDITPKCINCKGTHTSSSRNCPRFPKINKINSTKLANENIKTYANVTANKINENSNKNNNLNSTGKKEEGNYHSNSKSNSNDNITNSELKIENLETFLKFLNSQNFNNFIKKLNKLIELINSKNLNIILNLFDNYPGSLEP